MVMATGIIAVAAGQQDIDWLAQVLYVVAAHRLRRARRAARRCGSSATGPLFAADLTDHAKGFAFLTTVAGTNVLGAASAIIHGWWDLAWVLWWVGVVLWAVFLYATLIAVVIRHGKPGPGDGINGTWFLLTVSTESVAVLAALLLPRDDERPAGVRRPRRVHPRRRALPHRDDDGVPALDVPRRSTPPRPTRRRGSPPAPSPSPSSPASNLLLAAPASARIDRLAPFIEGIVVLAWATATFWFPLMVAIGVWRHIVRRCPAALPPVVLGARLPPRHVRRGDVPDARRDRPRRAGVVAETRLRRGAAGVAGQCVRPRPSNGQVWRRAAEQPSMTINASAAGSSAANRSIWPNRAARTASTC